MPKDIKREVLTGPRKFDEVMEKLETFIHEMMADDGPVPMDLVNVGTHDARTTQSDQDASNDMSRGKETQLAKEQARKDQTGQERGIEEKELMNGRVAKEMIQERREARMGPRAANLSHGSDEAQELKPFPVAMLASMRLTKRKMAPSEPCEANISSNNGSVLPRPSSVSGSCVKGSWFCVRRSKNGDNSWKNEQSYKVCCWH